MDFFFLAAWVFASQFIFRSSVGMMQGYVMARALVDPKQLVDTGWAYPCATAVAHQAQVDLMPYRKIILDKMAEMVKVVAT